VQRARAEHGLQGHCCWENHSFGLKEDGSIVAWGYNLQGQCNVPSPNMGFVAAAGGAQHSLGLYRPFAGACCQPDGTCSLMLDAGCTSPGIWQGAGTICNPNPCLLGACCLYLACEIYTPETCAYHGGNYRGNGTLCEPNPCPDLLGADDGTPDAMWLQLRVVPNPSAGGMMIRCQMPTRTKATLDVFDASGRMVRRLHEGGLPAGETSLSWDGRDDAGRDVPAGVYFVKVATSAGETSGGVVLTR